MYTLSCQRGVYVYTHSFQRPQLLSLYPTLGLILKEGKGILLILLYNISYELKCVYHLTIFSTKYLVMCKVYIWCIKASYTMVVQLYRR